jgi:hypothetical protein
MRISPEKKGLTAKIRIKYELQGRSPRENAQKNAFSPLAKTEKSLGRRTNSAKNDKRCVRCA